ncbi:MAG: glycosyltransferase family 9 protein [Desulfobacterales bacterium]
MKEDYLIIHQGALGDLILTLTAVNRVCKKPSGIFCRSGLIPLIRHLDIADEVQSVETRIFSQLYEDTPSIRCASLFENYHHILLFSNASILSKNIRSLTDAHVHRISPRPVPENRMHIVEHLTLELNRIGARCAPSRDKYRMKHADGDFGNSPSILIHPGSGSRRKNWPLENFVRIYHRLKRDGLAVKWIAGPAEKHMLDGLNVFGIDEENIYSNDLIGLCSRLREAGLLIGNDSGPSHLAAFLGTAVLTIFGPSDPVRWRPLGSHVNVMLPETRCIPCFESETYPCERPVCFKGITVEKVYRKVKHLVGA